jgi:DNA-binding response OmpR family regulator
VRKIAIVDDDPDELRGLVAMLSGQGHCVPFPDAHAFLKALHRDTFDLACIDWNLPDVTGIELVQRIRSGAQAPHMPVILITARSTDDDIVKGLITGADDYVTKPVSEPVLRARVDTLLRRLTPAADQQLETFGDYAFDHTRDVVIAGGEERVLTTKEFNLALLLFRNMHRPLARGYLMEEVWGAAANVSSRTLDTHVCRLKNKLGLTPANGYNFGPVYRFGYRLERTGARAAGLSSEAPSEVSSE